MHCQTEQLGHHRVAIVGAGFSGLAAAIRLKRDGIDDLVVLERAADVGGVWRDNTYPGCACDVQSHLYSFSFAPNPDWTHAYGLQPEILEYLRASARRFGVLPHLRLEHEVLRAAWQGARWRVETTRGWLTADVLIAANGGLSDPALPRIPGIERFAGPAFHSARWRHDVELDGRRVAVIGTGASAIQIVPAIQPRVARLLVFQRTPPWVLPRANHPISPLARRIYRALPVTQRIVRAAIQAAREALLLGFSEGPIMDLVERGARRYLRSTVADPVLRARLTPRYRIGCKRVLLSDDYLPALAQPNVEVVSEAIAEARPGSLVTDDGRVYPVDVMVFATGFQVTDPPIAHRIHGRDGETLAQAWRGSPKAYLGTTVAGFPNLFLLQGPNTGLGHTSVLLMMEAQLEQVSQALRHLARRRAQALEPHPRAQAAFVAEVDRRMRSRVWTTGGCVSWYIDATGRSSTLWPGTTLAFRRRLSRFVARDYVVRRADVLTATPADRPRRARPRARG